MDEIVEVDDFSTENSDNSDYTANEESETEDTEEMVDDEEDVEMPEAQFDASENDDSNDSIAIIEVCKKCEIEGELVTVNGELLCATCVVKLDEKKKLVKVKPFDISLDRNVASQTMSLNVLLQLLFPESVQFKPRLSCVLNHRS